MGASGCGSSAKENETIKASEGNATVTKDGNGGTVKVPSGKKSLPSGFPTDVPMPDDAVILSSADISTEDEKGYMITLTTGLDVEKCADFYREKLKLDASKLAGADAISPVGVTLVGEIAKYNLLVIIAPDGANGATTVTITLSAKE
ncbi:hypothetical protein PAENIP36_37580 [Paenibacillus sp. P36]